MHILVAKMAKTWGICTHTHTHAHLW